MRPATFRALRREIGLSQARLGDRLGYSQDAIGAFEKGEYRTGSPAPVPPAVALAMMALRHNLEPPE